MTDKTCPQCLHGWHGHRVCGDANCCSCRLRPIKTPIWVDLVLIAIVLAVGSWLLYLVLSEPL